MKKQNFIKNAKEIHGDKYDYSLVKYTNAHKNVILICPIHGQFNIRPDAHLHQKQGCKHCGLKNRKHHLQKSNETFIQQAKEKWQDKYDYSITNYINKITKIKYICLKHGEIEQLPVTHLRTGCSHCNGRGKSRFAVSNFIKIANEIHKNKYDYGPTKFLNISDEIEIICPQHGIFTLQARNHINLEFGCPKCLFPLPSKAEIEFTNYIKDFKIPENLIIEYHKLHYHTEITRGRKYHYDRWKASNEKNIQLIQIYENEFLNNKQLIFNKINYLLNKTDKIYARQTKVIEIAKNRKDIFLVLNHLQGQDSSKIYYGLEYNEELVSVMTFVPSRFNKNYKYELLRFCNKSNLSVVGGASKLLKHFRKNYPGSIISYADKRYSNGNLYHQLGFNLDGHTNPSYSYVNIKNKTLHNRIKFQKNIKNMPGYADNLKEYEVMQLNGYDRIWDAGHYRFVLP